MKAISGDDAGRAKALALLGLVVLFILIFILVFTFWGAWVAAPTGDTIPPGP